MESTHKDRDAALASGVPQLAKAEIADSGPPRFGDMMSKHGCRRLPLDLKGHDSCKDEHCVLLGRSVEGSDS